MRNSVDITRPYQFRYMLTRHIIAVLIVFVFEAVATYRFFENTVACYIVASVFTIVYGGIIYTAARKLADFDRKTYTPLKTDIKFGVLWGVEIAVFMLILSVIYIINHKIGNGDSNINIFIYSAINLIFYLLTAPYFGFIFVDPNNIPIYVFLLMTVVPIAACTLGYIAGAKNFDLVGTLDSLTFEKEDEDDE